jgi:secreted Zn-dependent insulinase-like peptidase
MSAASPSPLNTYVPPTLADFERALHLLPNHAPIAPIQSPEDKRSYRLITLANSLTALLISDVETEKSAASMNVNIGSFAEPSDALGLAHFLEHMLFMGTKKYPDENSYSLAINNYGGSQNAYTTRESTNYIFDVSSLHLEEILDRFAQFFVAPLCLESAVDRELLAVNNENERNLQIDAWRVNQVAESGVNPEHPLSRLVGDGYSCGIQGARTCVRAEGNDGVLCVMCSYARSVSFFACCLSLSIYLSIRVMPYMPSLDS